MINLYNQDCMIAMQQMKDNEYDLAICDPPYGGSANKLQNIPNYGGNNQHLYQKPNWNIAPPEKYFSELRRVSRNQIVWGGNYFPSLWDRPARGFIFWNKKQISKLHADGELAWTSFDRNAKMLEYRWCGALAGDSNKASHNIIHVTQKPVALYTWLLDNYAKHGDRILDTHLGSGSIAIACSDMGYDLDAYEIDAEYYQNALNRLQNHQRQLKLW